MHVPRFYHPGKLATEALVKLQEDAAHHALHVLRMTPGDALILFNGEGGEYRGEIAEAGKRDVSVRLLAFAAVERESPLDITLVQGISAADRMDYCVQKAVELGVRAIQPVMTEKAVVRLRGERADKKREHWQRIVIAACEQSGRTRIPRLGPVQTLSQWLAARDQQRLAWLLDPDAAESLASQQAPNRPVDIVIGPESGFSQQEVDALKRAGCTPLLLGPRVLRTETAAPAVLAVMQSRWGDFRQ